MRNHITMSLLCLAAWPAQASVAQDRAPLDSGEVVKLHWAAGSQVTARLLAPLDSGTTSIVYCRAAAIVCGAGTVNPAQRRPRRELIRVDIAQGHRVAHGAAIGALVGVAWGALVMYAAVQSESPRALNPVAALPIGAGLGIGIGAAIGAVSRRWVPAP
jgi:hypothetical protein